MFSLWKYRSQRYSGGKFISIGEKIRLPDDVTMGYIIAGDLLISAPRLILISLNGLDPPWTSINNLSLSFSAPRLDQIKIKDERNVFTNLGPGLQPVETNPGNESVTVVTEHLLRKPLTVIDKFHSHLEPMKFLRQDTFHQQITFSYSRYSKDEMNVLKIDGFDHRLDPTSLPMSMNPVITWSYLSVREEDSAI
uniref:Fringe-like glycosyltransferase domain-containing protein n=1 Tax=Timema douglasi TaxID=61478 RepID=A0A7R8ZC66_TIMDO|nr:unnamed protein product [Timema douglasi]